MAWTNLASTLWSTGTSIDSGTFDAKKFLIVLCRNIISTSTSNVRVTFNNDTALNYAARESIDGGSDATNTSQGNSDNLTNTSADLGYCIFSVANIPTEEKLFINFGMVAPTGSANPPTRRETVVKWVNTSDSITSIQAFTGGTGTFTTNSELVIFGSD